LLESEFTGGSPLELEKERSTGPDREAVHVKEFAEKVEKVESEGVGNMTEEAADGVATVVSQDSGVAKSANKELQFGKTLLAKRKATEVEDRRRVLLQSLTDQLKKVMAKISDPATTERNRDQLQLILATIKDKITALTPRKVQPKTARHGRPSLAPEGWNEDEDDAQSAPGAGAPGGPRPPRWGGPGWRPRPRAPPSAAWQWSAPHVAPAASAVARAASSAAGVAAAVGAGEDDAASVAETVDMESDIEDPEALRAIADEALAKSASQAKTTEDANVATTATAMLGIAAANALEKTVPEPVQAAPAPDVREHVDADDATGDNQALTEARPSEATTTATGTDAAVSPPQPVADASLLASVAESSSSHAQKAEAAVAGADGGPEDLAAALQAAGAGEADED